MNRVALSLIMVFNSFVLAACASYKPAAIPTDPASEAEAASQAPELRAGMEARIHLLSGNVVEGEVVSMTESLVTLGNPTNRGFVETTIAFDDIEKCEVLTDEGSAVWLAGTVGVIIVIVAIGAAAFGHALSGIGDLD